jgi:hypothetical protein
MPPTDYVDIGIVKNTRFANGHNIPFRVDMFNATNTRNFGDPGRAHQLGELHQPVVHHRWQPARAGGVAVRLRNTRAGFQPSRRVPAIHPIRRGVRHRRSRVQDEFASSGPAVGRIIIDYRTGAPCVRS